MNQFCLLLAKEKQDEETEADTRGPGFSPSVSCFMLLVVFAPSSEERGAQL